MKSKAHFKGHPIHPILVSFPIAFFAGTVIADVLGMILQKDHYHNMAAYLSIAGVGFGLLAAIPGIIDYQKVIPPNSSAKKRGTKHALLNVTVIILFFIAWLIRDRDGMSLYLILGIEILGFILVSISGWLGGTLVYRNQIGVDIRYAGAGKWKEKEIKKESAGGERGAFVCNTDELQLNQMMLVYYNDKRIVVGRTENGYTAFDDRCTHRGGSLAGGSLICGTVQCPWHGSQFDVTSGEVKAGPAKEKIQVYKVYNVEEKVYLENI